MRDSCTPSSTVLAGTVLACIVLAAVLVVGIAAPCTAADAENGSHDRRREVHLATLHWPPYVAEGLQDNGYAAAVVREAFARSGYETRLSFLPWARVVHNTVRGDYDGYFPEYHARALEAHFAYSLPFPGGPLGFFARRDSNIRWTSLPELVGYRIGTVRGYVNTKAFDDATYLTVEPAVDDLTNLRKLLAGRIDLMVADKHVGRALAVRHMPERADELVFLDPPLEDKDLYLCIRRDNPRQGELLRAFNQELASMRDDGSLDALRRSHGM